MAWKTSSSGQKVWQSTESENKASSGISSDTKVNDPNKLAPTPKPKVDVAQNMIRNESSFNRQGATGSEGTEFNPAKALQDQKGVNAAPVSPYVGIDKTDVTNENVEPVAPALPSVDKATAGESGIDTTDTMTQATDELSPGFDQWSQEYGQLFDIAEEAKDDKIQSYDDLYNRQIQRLDQLQQTMEELTSQKNSLIAGSADIQAQEIEAAYDSNKEALKLAQERLANIQRKTLAEREKQLDRKKVNEENMLAVIGGFGSMAGNKMLIDSIDEGEDKIAWLKTEFSLQDQELSNKVVDLTNTYKTDKLKVEQWKQEKIMENYENLQSYIEKIVNSEDMADQEKVEAINRAKDQYNNTISELSQTVIDARFELSRDIIARSDELRSEMEAKTIRESEQAKEAIGDARSDLALLTENYALEDWGSLSDDVKGKITELEAQADLPPGFTEVAIENMKAQNAGKDIEIRSQTDNEGNWTIVGVDKNTGNVVATNKIKGAGKAKNTPTNEFESAFGVGEIGGWCGDFASKVSTGAKVGDTWDQKINKVSKNVIPQGDKPPLPGYKIAIPLGVTDSGSDYGHMAVVLDYNPETQRGTMIQSNADGRQTRGEGQGIISVEEFDINEWKEQYGTNWGFIEGEFTPKYAKIAEKYGLVGDEEGTGFDINPEETPEQATENTDTDKYADEFSDL